MADSDAVVAMKIGKVSLRESGIGEAFRPQESGRFWFVCAE
jgi:hypothetical protein